MLRLLAYLLAITVAEVITFFLNPIAGIVLYTVILIVIIFDAAIINKYYYERLVLSLSLFPVLRLVSIVIGGTLFENNIPQIWQYPIIYAPLLVTAIVLARILEYKPRDIGISFGFIPLQLAIGVLGVGLGIAEYFVLTPEPLVAELTWQTAWLPALVLLLATGFVEEFIFRGVLQKTATEALGGWGIVYISCLFAVMHLSWLLADSPLAPLDLVLVFAIALFFGWLVKKTGLLLGVTLAHGMTNIMLFIVSPFLF